ncbi:MAG: phasin family protein [Actinomycetota bacterium]|nr:phasin family protein [Actinomycetota bacterium]
MESNDIPYLVIGALASLRGESVKSVDDVIAKGKEIAEKTRSRAKKTAGDKKLDAQIEELIKKGKKQREELIKSIAATVKDTLNSLGIVTKTDIKEIDKRLAALEKKVTGKPSKKPAAKKPSSKKPAAKKAAPRKPAKKA